MSVPDNVIPLPKPRSRRGSRVASSEQVLVYKILHKAGRPLAVPEIADQVPRTGYLSFAMNAYREHKEETDPTWLIGKSDPWPKDCQREAMVWWVRGIVEDGLHAGRFSVKTKRVTNRATRAIITEGSYTPGRPPTVSVMEYREHKKLVPWTPELDSMLNRGPVAGVEFLQKLADYRTRDRHNSTETRDLLDLAEQAIRVHWPADL